jgi:SHS2 domain-containing protein
LIQAARGFYAVIGDLAAGSTRIEHPIMLQGPDREALLRDWVAELLYRLETRNQWFEEFVFSRCNETQLNVTAKGAVIDPDASKFDREVKAVTLHDLEVKEIDGGWTGRFLLDI